jgi:hypothetical protein
VRANVAKHGGAIVIVAIGLAGIAYAALRMRDVYVGDAAVYLPYARNAADGHPFQFNVGEFSSGSTSPLWSLVLAVPYAFGLGLAGAKAISAAFAALGLAVTVVAARQLTRSWTASAVAGLFVLGTMVFYAASLYESGLVVVLGALALIAGERALRMWDADGTIKAASLAPLGLVWAALPLVRPDSMILIGAQAVSMVAFARVNRRRVSIAVLITLAVAAIPAALYFGYSLADLGTFSTSSQGRSEALREFGRQWIGPLYLSGDAVRELFGRPWVFGLVPASIGTVLFARAKHTRWLAAYGVLALLGYLALLSFVTPGFLDTPRYLLPVVPLVAVGIARALVSARGSRYWLPALAAGLLVVGGSGAYHLRDRVNFARSIGITNREVFERDVVDTINRLAAPRDRVLSYEVQTRYYLRRDLAVLSQDGITDGKVAPYQGKRDLTPFLLRYRPDWWIADANAETRPYMDGSVFERAFLAFKSDRRRATGKFDGIGFELVSRRTRRLTPGFGGWQMLFKLTYPPSTQLSAGSRG